MPRHRSVRLATTGATAQRTASSTFGSRSGGTLGRRVVVVGLVLLSLVMITAYFREGDAGALHSVQGTGARVLEPFQIGAERVVRPFRDAWGWFDGLRTAKSENTKLKREIAALHAKAARTAAAPPATQIGGILSYAHAPTYSRRDYRLLEADVITPLLSYQQQVAVSAGSRDSVKRYDPVVSTTTGALLGYVSKVASGSSLVTLISDRSSAVAVVDIDTMAKGILRGGGPDAGSLLMDQVAKSDVVGTNDDVTTAGQLSGGSFYPRGIPVGKVDSFSQSDTDPFKLVHVKPYADLGSVDRVVILLRKGPVPSLP